MRAKSLILLLGLALPISGWSADCEAPYTTDVLLTDMSTLEEHLRTANDAEASSVANKMATGLGCLNEVLPTMMAGRVYRDIAAGMHPVDADKAKPWFLASIELDPAYVFGIDEIGLDHPARGAFESYKSEGYSDPVRLDERELIEGGKHFLDGRALKRPEARLGRPHLYQFQGSSVQSWIIDGNSFPDAQLAAPAVAEVDPTETENNGKPPKEPKVKEPKPPKEPKVKEPKEPKEPKVKEPKPTKEPKEAKVKEPKPPKEPKEAKPKDPSSNGGSGNPNTVVRDRPPEKIPLIVGGAAALIGAGAMYYWSSTNLDKFQTAGSEEELDRYRSNTNQIVVAAGAVAAVGAGSLTWGAIVSDRGAFASFRFRF